MTAGLDGCLDLTDIQGIAFYAYSHHPFARYLLVTFGPDRTARSAWLAELVKQVRSADEARHAHVRHDEPWHLQIALTYRGLEALGLSVAELEGFPREFVMGMNHDERTKKLGDPPQKHWQFGAQQHEPVHALIMLFGRTQADLDTLHASQLAALTAAGAKVAHDDRATLQPGSREHFGFHDGVSQPHLAGGPRTHRDPDPSLPAGELLLGHRDAYGQTAPSPLVRGFDLGRNGSYLVYRKLSQHVFTFWQTLRTQARPLPGENQTDAAIRLGAAMVGRWPGGTPVVVRPAGDRPQDSTENDFGYASTDPFGYRCPIGSHMRRANPRDMLPSSTSDSLDEVRKHRIFRRGRPYGDPLGGGRPWEAEQDDGAERGLIFVGLCGSLRRQFEFIQQTWLNNPTFAGLAGETDPMIGDGERRFTLQREPVRRCLVGLPKFTELRGGGYFFLPGVTALQWLTER
jgi:Dyp-type peroxidase family